MLRIFISYCIVKSWKTVVSAFWNHGFPGLDNTIQYKNS